jgi:hypothetical protein
MSSKSQIWVYYFPNWHVPSQTNIHLDVREGEWPVVQAMKPRFPGHQQPKVPLWGYEDECDVAVMTKKIDAAADHAITGWIWDWYWRDEGPFLHTALEKAYLKAPNRERLKFCVMWANHAPVTAQTFVKATDHIIQEYFSLPNYLTIDGKPYFSLYEFHTLIQGLGGVENTYLALENFRARTVKAGFPGLHFNAVEWGLQLLPGVYATHRDAFLALMRIDSVTSYVWFHNDVMPEFPTNPYPEVAVRAYDFWQKHTQEFHVPYHPNVTMGWDSWPRVKPGDPFEPAAYPRTPLIVDNTPTAFQHALHQAYSYLQTLPESQSILTINAWNEWTEGSYLEPDTQYGLGYLQAIRAVFGS